MSVKFYAERGVSVYGCVDVTHYLAVEEIDGVRYTQVVEADERQSLADRWSSGDRDGANMYVLPPSIQSSIG